MFTAVAPNSQVQQLSASDGEQYLLSVIAKRTYAVDSNGNVSDAELQLPLATELALNAVDRNLLEQDSDLIAMKERTDIVVRGHAYAMGETQHLVVSIVVGDVRKDIAVLGDRRCALSAVGKIVFSEPRKFSKISLSCKNAYGGRDVIAEEKYGNPAAVCAPYFAGTFLRTENMSPYLYPRNPCGKGFLIDATKEALEWCELPNLEDPADMLGPERILVRHTDLWAYMPIPQCLGWMNWGWFPRARFACIPCYFRPQDYPIPEVARGMMPQKVLDTQHPRAMPREQLARFLNGAALDLQLPSLRGGEILELRNVHPTVERWRFRIPGKPRRLCVDGREGKLSPTTPVLHTVLIEPDESRISVVWRGSAPARRPYFPEELESMPLLVEW